MSIRDNETNKQGIRKTLIPAISDTPRTDAINALPPEIAQIMESIDVECGLCRNEGADDIAGLLQEVYSAMSFLVGKVGDLERELAEKEREIARLKGFAEGMAECRIDRPGARDCVDALAFTAAVKAYRRAYPKQEMEAVLGPDCDLMFFPKREPTK